MMRIVPIQQAAHWNHFIAILAKAMGWEEMKSYVQRQRENARWN